MLNNRAVWFLATDNYLPHLRGMVTTLKDFGKLGDVRMILVALGECKKASIDWFKQAGLEVIFRGPKGGDHRKGLRWKWHKTQIFNYFPELDETLYLDCDMVVTSDVSGIWEFLPRQRLEAASIPWSTRPHGDPFTVAYGKEFYAMGYKCFRTGLMLFRRGVSDEFLEAWGAAICDWPVRSSTMDQPQLYNMLYTTSKRFIIRPVLNRYDYDTKNGLLPTDANYKIVHYHNVMPRCLPQFKYLLRKGFVNKEGVPTKL